MSTTVHSKPSERGKSGTRADAKRRPARSTPRRPGPGASGTRSQAGGTLATAALELDPLKGKNLCDLTETLRNKVMAVKSVLLLGHHTIGDYTGVEVCDQIVYPALALAEELAPIAQDVLELAWRAKPRGEAVRA